MGLIRKEITFLEKGTGLGCRFKVVFQDHSLEFSGKSITTMSAMTFSEDMRAHHNLNLLQESQYMWAVAALFVILLRSWTMLILSVS